MSEIRLVDPGYSDDCGCGDCECPPDLPCDCQPARPSVLEEAMMVVSDRASDYDHPLPNHERIAAMWTVILGRNVTPLDVVYCMVAVKLARLVATADHYDSLVDIAGYVDCAAKIIDAQER